MARMRTLIVIVGGMAWATASWGQVEGLGRGPASTPVTGGLTGTPPLEIPIDDLKEEEGEESPAVTKVRAQNLRVPQTIPAIRKEPFPIFPRDPLAEGKGLPVVMDIVFDPAGNPVGAYPWNSPGNEFITPAAKAVAESPRVGGWFKGKPALALLRFQFDAYFFREDTALAEETPPKALWRLSFKELRDMLGAPWLPTERQIRLGLQVNDLGEIAEVYGGRHFEQRLVPLLFDNPETFSFEPLEREGLGEPCKLMLNLPPRLARQPLQAQETIPEKDGVVPDLGQLWPAGTAEPLRVALHVRVNAEGDFAGMVGDASLGMPLFRHLAQAIRQWNFKPYQVITPIHKFAIQADYLLRLEFAGPEGKLVSHEMTKLKAGLPSFTHFEMPHGGGDSRPGAERIARLTYEVGTDGHGHSLDLSHIPDADLRQAIEAVFPRWRFEPGHLNGEPVAMQVYQMIAFEAAPEESDQ